MLFCEVLIWVAFLAVARGPTMSQADRPICSTWGIQCIDERVTIGILQIRWTDDGDKDVVALATMCIAEVPNESSISQRSFYRMF